MRDFIADLVDYRFQFSPVHWFRDVIREARLHASIDIFFHAMAANRDPVNRIPLSQVSHEFAAATVRQIQIAN